MDVCGQLHASAVSCIGDYLGTTERSGRCGDKVFARAGI